MPRARLLHAHIAKTATKRAPTVTTPTMSGGERPPVRNEPGWRAGEEVVVGKAVTRVGPVGTAEGVVLSPADGEGEVMSVMVAGGAKTLVAWSVGRGRLRVSHA